MKVLLKIILALFLLLFVLFSTFWLFIYFRKDELKKSAVEYLNQQLKTKVEVGEIDIRFFKTFPDVYVEIQNFELLDPMRFHRKVLASEAINMSFDFWDLYNQHYRIKKLEIINSHIHLFWNKDGQYNFDIFNPSKNSNSTFTLELKKVELRNTELEIISDKSGIKSHSYIHNLSFTGAFSEQNFQMEINANCDKISFSQKGKSYLRNDQLILKTKLDINNDNKNYKIQFCELLLNQTPFNIKGNIAKEDLNFTFNTGKLELVKIYNLLPEYIPAQVKLYKTSGDLIINGRVFGKLIKPDFEFNFQILNGDVQKENIKHLSKINLDGRLNLYLSKQAYHLNIPICKAELGQSGALNLKLSLTKNVETNLDIQGSLYSNLSELAALLPLQAIEKLGGKCELNFNIKKTQKDSVWKNNFNLLTINIQNASIKLKNEVSPFENVFLKASLENENLKINQFNFNRGKSDIQATCIIYNALGIFENKNDKIKSEVQLKSNQLNTEDLLFSLSDSMGKTKESIQTFNIHVNGDINRLVHQKFSANECKFDADLNNDLIKLNQIQCQTFNGQIKGNAQLLTSIEGNHFVQAETQLTNVNISQMFRDCGEFGQAEITSANLDGTLSGNIIFSGVWDKSWTCNLKKIKSIADIKISNGQLINYKPLESLSSYIKLDDLKNIRFADLQNQIEISDETIRIPKMEIKNSALNLSLNGEHTFNNYIDYSFQIRLNDWLKKKWKLFQKETAEDEIDESKGGLTLYISMKGPSSNPKITYNKVKVKTLIKKSAKDEIQTIKQMIKEDFNLQKNQMNNIKKSQEKTKTKTDENESLEFENE